MRTPYMIICLYNINMYTVLNTSCIQTHYITKNICKYIHTYKHNHMYSYQYITSGYGFLDENALVTKCIYKLRHDSYAFIHIGMSHLHSYI